MQTEKTIIRLTVDVEVQISGTAEHGVAQIIGMKNRAVDTLERITNGDREDIGFTDILDASVSILSEAEANS